MSGLAAKLLLPYALLAIVIAAALGQVAYEARVRARAAEKEVDEIQDTNAYLAQLNQLSYEIQRNVLAYQVRPNDGFLTMIRALEEEARGVVEEIGRVAIPARGAMLWREFVVDDQLLEQARRELLEERRAGVIGDDAPVFSKWRLVSEQTSALLADFTTYNVTRLDVTTAADSQRRGHWLATLAAVIACSIALALLSSAYLTRRVIRPLASMTATADRIAAERTGLKVSGEDRPDEIGVLARAFNRMTGDLVDANAKLVEAVRARDEFLSIASHELKTPLTSAKLQLQLEGRRIGVRNAGRGEGLPRWLAVSLRQLDRLEALIATLLDVTRMRAGRFETTPETVDLSAVVESVVERFSEDLARSSTEAQLELEPGVVGRWDAGRIDQVVTNLLANALKYAPGAPLHVAVARRDAHAVLTIRDGGPGMTDEVRARAFSPFERASNTRSIGGLGLGLYIVKGIVDAHHGTVSVESRPGSGASFVIELPLDGVARGGPAGDAA